MRINLMLDFYGDLLTKKQRRILESYYALNFSLVEIAQEERSSRQAVHNLLHRGVQILEDLETKLSMVRDHLARKQSLKKACSEINNILAICPDKIKPGLFELMQRLERLAEKE